MELNQRYFFWSVSLLALALFFWLFNPVLLPFVTGGIIAYLLNPLVIRLEALKLSRTLSALCMLSVFILLLCLLVVLAAPRVYRELLQLADAAPGYVDALWQKLQPMLNSLGIELADVEIDQSLRELLKNNIGRALDISSILVSEILSSGRAILDVAVFLLLTPLVSFMLLKDWPQLADWFEEMLPRQQKDKVMDLLGKIDTKIAGFVRGQLIVAAALGMIYAIALSLAGLEYGILIGLLSGVLSIIPLFGSIVGMLVSVVTAYFQEGTVMYVLLIGGIFASGQFLEGNFITPRVMSGSVGLHPLWILFSLMAGNALLGVIGMLVAIPVAASTGVLLDYAIEQYKDSGYYKD